MPPLSSDQARANGAQPRMSELELQRLLHACAANDKTNAELAAEFGKAPSTVYNIKVKYRDQIEDIRRKWTVQFEDLWMTRKQARLDEELRDLAWEQLRALLAANCVIDGRTGEVMAGPVDERKFKVYAELILKTNRNFAEETGQLPQRVEGLDQRFTQPVLGIRGRGIDYTRIAQREREWEAEAPQREAAKRERKAAVEAEMESLKRQIIASVDVDPRAGEQRELEQWLTGEEQRRAQGLGPEDEWDQEGFAQLRRDFALVLPGDGAMAARVERFIESASRTDEQEQVKEQKMDIVRLVPPRKAAEEPEVEQVPEPEHDPYESLREAFIGALSGGYRAADDNELMLRLRQSGVRFEVDEFFAVLGELVDDDVVVEDGTGIRLSENYVAVA